MQAARKLILRDVSELEVPEGVLLDEVEDTAGLCWRVRIPLCDDECGADTSDVLLRFSRRHPHEPPRVFVPWRNSAPRPRFELKWAKSAQFHELQEVFVRAFALDSWTPITSVGNVVNELLRVVGDAPKSPQATGLLPASMEAAMRAGSRGAHPGCREDRESAAISTGLPPLSLPSPPPPPLPLPSTRRTHRSARHPSPATLLTAEILTDVLTYLPVSDIGRLATTSQAFAEVCDSEVLWARLYFLQPPVSDTLAAWGSGIGPSRIWVGPGKWEWTGARAAYQRATELANSLPDPSLLAASHELLEADAMRVTSAILKLRILCTSPANVSSLLDYDMRNASTVMSGVTEAVLTRRIREGAEYLRMVAQGIESSQRAPDALPLSSLVNMVNFLEARRTLAARAIASVRAEDPNPVKALSSAELARLCELMQQIQDSGQANDPIQDSGQANDPNLQPAPPGLNAPDAAVAQARKAYRCTRELLERNRKLQREARINQMETHNRQRLFNLTPSTREPMTQALADRAPAAGGHPPPLTTPNAAATLGAPFPVVPSWNATGLFSNGPARTEMEQAPPQAPPQDAGLVAPGADLPVFNPPVGLDAFMARVARPPGPRRDRDETALPPGPADRARGDPDADLVAAALAADPLDVRNDAMDFLGVRDLHTRPMAESAGTPPSMLAVRDLLARNLSRIYRVGDTHVAFVLSLAWKKLTLQARLYKRYLEGVATPVEELVLGSLTRTKIGASFMSSLSHGTQIDMRDSRGDWYAGRLTRSFREHSATADWAASSSSPQWVVCFDGYSHKWNEVVPNHVSALERLSPLRSHTASDSTPSIAPSHRCEVLTRSVLLRKSKRQRRAIVEGLHNAAFVLSPSARSASNRQGDDNEDGDEDEDDNAADNLKETRHREIHSAETRHREIHSAETSWQRALKKKPDLAYADDQPFVIKFCALGRPLVSFCTDRHQPLCEIVEEYLRITASFNAASPSSTSARAAIVVKNLSRESLENSLALRYFKAGIFGDPEDLETPGLSEAARTRGEAQLQRYVDVEQNLLTHLDQVFTLYEYALLPSPLDEHNASLIARGARENHGLLHEFSDTAFRQVAQDQTALLVPEPQRSSSSSPNDTPLVETAASGATTRSQQANETRAPKREDAISRIQALFGDDVQVLDTSKSAAELGLDSDVLLDLVPIG